MYVESCSLEMAKVFGNDPYVNGRSGIVVRENPLTVMSSCERSEGTRSSWVSLSVCCNRKLSLILFIRLYIQ